MDERDLTAEAEADARESGALLFIALIVLLIGFFVVLNHASSVESARSRAVMGSVAATFGPPDPEAESMHAFTADLGDVLEDGVFALRLGKLVATAFPLAKLSETKPGEVYEVNLPVTSMWIGASDAPSQAGQRFVGQVAALLAAPPSRTVYRLAAWMDPGGAGGRDRAIRRVSVFADALVAAGAPRARIDSGLAPGRPIMLRLVFTIRPAAEPAQ